jgi:hypothetical protein
MRYVKLLFSFFLLFQIGISTAQSDSTLRDFTLDSTGCMGLRNKHIQNPDSSNGAFDIHIDQQSMIGKTRKEILLLLGKPNDVEYFLTPKKEKRLLKKGTWEYYLCGPPYYGTSIVVYFHFNTVSGIGLRFYCS